ncbi:MAG: hypothetical protein K9N21_00855 [Deltaproteobacteria bacterium]|nr:hypothetical protein [Deltaproteobacteria bacterium]
MDLSGFRSIFVLCFQLDTADLDFAIYRLFAARREEVERFIDKELPASVDAAFSDLPDELPGLAG